MKIGDVHVGKLALAPMAGVNCTSFRLLCKYYGASLLYTQMYDADRINKIDDDEICDLLNIQKDNPISIQLIGRDPGSLSQAASKVEKYADIIDLNFGCVESEWLAKKTGSYFLTCPDRMGKIIDAVSGAVKCPVTVKTRLGWDSFNPLIPKIVAESGAKAIAIHTRTRKQGYMGNARSGWHHLKKISDDIDIRLIGNGDVNKPSHVKALLEYSGCDMVMIGRTAMDNPYFFKQCQDYLSNGEFNPEIRPIDMFDRFVKLYDSFETREKIAEIRDHAIWFLKNTRQSRRARNELVKTKTIDQVNSIVKKFGEPYNL